MLLCLTERVKWAAFSVWSRAYPRYWSALAQPNQELGQQRLDQSSGQKYPLSIELPTCFPVLDRGPHLFLHIRIMKVQCARSEVTGAPLCCEEFREAMQCIDTWRPWRTSGALRSSAMHELVPRIAEADLQTDRLTRHTCEFSITASRIDALPFERQCQGVPAKHQPTWTTTEAKSDFMGLH